MVEVDHAVQVRMKRGTLGHPFDNAPQVCCLKQRLGLGKKHARVNGHFMMGLFARTPYRRDFVSSDPSNDGICPFGNGRKRFAKWSVGAEASFLVVESGAPLDELLYERVGRAGNILSEGCVVLIR